ncbi:MAG: signal peptidase I [Oligoflexia bacterium]|nr:MAG: signal peptidase I [Oligoflexia bacterium]
MDRSYSKKWRDYLENILVAIFLALFVRTFILTGYKVPTSSMAPTLKPGDFIFAYRLPYGVKIPLSAQKLSIKVPERGDVVVFTYPDQPRVSYVKRVVGLPGDRIEIINGELFINEQKSQYAEKLTDEILDLPGYDQFRVMTETFSQKSHEIILNKSTSPKSFGPFIVPQKQIFLLGDNRDASDDSRYWGGVPIDRVEGKVIMIWLSLDSQKKWGDNRFPSIRTDRLFHKVE